MAVYFCERTGVGYVVEHSAQRGKAGQRHKIMKQISLKHENSDLSSLMCDPHCLRFTQMTFVHPQNMSFS